MIQFHRSDYSTDRVVEVLTDQGDGVDHRRLTNYLLRSNLTTQRIFGLIFDRLQLDVDRKLAESARSSTADSRLTTTGQTYSAKWRLSYDPAMFRHYELQHQA
jgi:hypothetical protein